MEPRVESFESTSAGFSQIIDTKAATLGQKLKEKWRQRRATVSEKSNTESMVEERLDTQLDEVKEENSNNDDDSSKVPIMTEDNENKKETDEQPNDASSSPTQQEGFFNFEQNDTDQVQLRGGHSDEKDVDEEKMALFKQEFKSVIETKSGKVYNTFEPLAYTHQVVAGTIYKIKIRVDDNKIILAKVFKPLPHTGEPAVCETLLDDQFEDVPLSSLE